MKVIGYIRVSSEGQVANGASIDVQKDKIGKWCVLYGHELIDLYVDAGISGKRADNRPGLSEALERACKEKAALVVYSMSRLARSTRDALAISERLDKAGADLVSLTEDINTTSAAGKMVFRMLAVLAEFERDIISERTIAAMAHLRRQNRRISRHVPYGYDLSTDNESLVPNTDEQEAVALMKTLRADDMTFREVIDTLDSRGIRTKTGKPWSPKVIRGIILREDRTAAGVVGS